MEDSSGASNDVAERAICLECIGDLSLRGSVQANATRIQCHYCEKRRKGITIGTLADSVDTKVREYYGHGPFERRFDTETDKTFEEQEGESLLEMLQSEAGIDHTAAVDLSEVLVDSDPADVAGGEEVFYSDQQLYERIDLPEGEYGERWEQFSHRIKHERRFFDQDAKELLEGILGAAGSKIATDVPAILIGPEERVKVVYRARRADTRELAEQIATHAPKELSRPPKQKAKAGRMNAAGIAVFYGSMSEDVALSEVRPSVGSGAIVGRFPVIRRLKILDLSRIDHGLTGSIFHPDYERNASRLRFLEGFHHLIARPVQPDDEPLEYIPTQAVAEYVHNVLGFDGILYGSAQVGAITPPEPGERRVIEIGELTDDELKQYNVVLFGNAGAVKGVDEHPLPPGLDFDPKGTTSRVITGVTYSHEWLYVSGLVSDDDTPF